MADYSWRNWLRRVGKTLAGGNRPSAVSRRGKRALPQLEMLERRELLTAPAVLSIARTDPVGPITSATSVNYSVTFNEPVQNVNNVEFGVTTSGSVQIDRRFNRSDIVVTIPPGGTGAFYFVTINGISGSGDLRLDLIDHDTITDANGTPLGGPGFNNGSFQGQTYTILQPHPSVVSINRTPPAGPTIGPGSASYTVTFSEPVTGVVPADFQVAQTGSATAATPLVVVGSGAVYTVTVTGVTGNGMLGLNLVDNGSIHDLAGNPLASPEGTPISFANPSSSAAGYFPRALTTADLRGNGPRDLIVANLGDNSVSVLLANRDGTFQNQQTFAAGLLPISVAATDVNGDGRPDLVVADAGSGSVSVLLGNGDGSFQAAQTFTAGSLPYAVAVADLNGDGKPDLVVADRGGNSVNVLLGNGDGTFQPPQTFAGGGDPVAVAVADVNGDGKVDLLVANNGASNVNVLLGNGDGSFQSMGTFAAGAGTASVAVADVNGDGTPDLVVANPAGGSVSVLTGNGDGTFQAPQSFAAGSSPVAVAIADVNGHGKPDLIVANLLDGDVSVLSGNGDGSFQPQQTFATGPYPLAVAVGDFNSDGKLDIVALSALNGNLSVLRNPAQGDFTGQVYTVVTPPMVQSINRTTPAGPIIAAGSVTYTVTFNEPVNGVDANAFRLAVTGSTSAVTPVTVSGSGAVYTVMVSGITGAGTLGLNVVDHGTIQDSGGRHLAPPGGARPLFADQGTFATASSPQAVVVADVNGDGKPDLVVASTADHDVGVLLGNGNGSFQNQQTFAAGNSPAAVAVADVNGDGKPDLVVANYRANTVGVLLGNGNGTFQAQFTSAVGTLPTSVAVADVNGDGKPDLVVANYRANTVGVLLGNGDGSFQAMHAFATSYGPRSVAVADVNGDGKPDLVVAYGSDRAHGVSVLLGNGDGSFQSDHRFRTDAFPASVVATDVNGDGKLDLVTANDNSNTVNVLLGNGDGSFQSQLRFATGQEPQSVAVADVNSDGKPDLVVANRGDNTASVLLGDGGGVFENQQTFATGPFPAAVVLADLNGDGNLDLVVANSGSNSIGVLLGSGAAKGDFTGQVYIIHSPTATWTGTTSTDWGTAANWANNDPPLAGDDVVIPGGLAHQPVLDTSHALRNLTIQAGATLSLAGNGLTVGGSFTNRGTVRLQGNEIVQLTPDAGEGTWTYVGDGTGGNITIKDFGSAGYFNLTIDDTHLQPDTFRLAGALTVTGNLTIGDLTPGAATDTLDASGQNVTVAGLATIAGTLVGSNNTFAGNLTLAGDAAISNPVSGSMLSLPRALHLGIHTLTIKGTGMVILGGPTDGSGNVALPDGYGGALVAPAAHLSQLTDAGSLAVSGSVKAGVIDRLAINGALQGSVAATSFGQANVGSISALGSINASGAIGFVAVQGSVPAGAIHAGSIQALAFGSVVEKGRTVTADVAASTDAAQLLSSGTLFTPPAGTFTLGLTPANDEALFMAASATGFDWRKVLLTDAGLPGAPLSAALTFTAAGSSSALTQIDFTGDGGSVNTVLPITTAVTSTGWLGDLIESAPQGLTANVTAAAIRGNVMASAGPIAGTIRTTGDLGVASSNSSGQVTGVTFVLASKDFTGQLIAGGNLVSQVTVVGAASGTIAVQGDLGVLQCDSHGKAQVGSDPARSLRRFGGLATNGAFSGQVVVLGNSIGDLLFGGPFNGRLAVKGRQEYGLDPWRYGVLGIVTINSTIGPSAALVSAGLLGDDGANNLANDFLGTHLNVTGAVKGIVAAEEDINVGSMPGGTKYAPFVGEALAGTASGQAIDWIFTRGGVALTVVNAADLTSILQDLANLKAGADASHNPILTGTVQ